MLLTSAPVKIKPASKVSITSYSNLIFLFSKRMAIFYPVYDEIVAAIFDFVFDFIFPRFCVVCGQEGAFLCRRCKRGLPMALQVCPMCTRPSIYGLTHDYCTKKLGMEGLIAIFDHKK